MQVTVIGTGYVGLVTGAGLADMGNQVICVDHCTDKINLLNDGRIPIFEPHLEELVLRNVSSQRLSFTTDLKTAVNSSDILMLAINTPPTESGSLSTEGLFLAAKQIGQAVSNDKIVVVKSTVPVGTCEEIKNIIEAELKDRSVSCEISVASNPEFLKEGAAVKDFMFPDRIIIGSQDNETKEVLEELYRPFVRSNERVIHMDLKSSEMTKLAANAMLAAKISFINEISHLCDNLGADVTLVRSGIASDSRIGPHFIYPGIGFGGSCLPKDLDSLCSVSTELNLDTPLIHAIKQTNQFQKKRFVDQISREFPDGFAGKKLALWGLSFKPETNDIRNSPAIEIAESLISKGAFIVAHDPAANAAAREHFGSNDQFETCSDQYSVLREAEVLIVATEWKPFRSPDFPRIKQLLKRPIIFDGRNLYSKKIERIHNFTLHAIGH